MKNITAKFKSIYKERDLLLLITPTLILFFIFNYIPIYGLTIGFKDMKPGLTMFNSPWVGLRWFNEFLNSPYFWRSLKNTITLSVSCLIIQFPIPILFALCINELRNGPFKRITQSVSYFPHFMSTVVVMGMLFNFLGVDNGIVNTILRESGRETINFFNDPNWFRPMYIFSGIWQNMGWSSILYLSALTSIDPTLYEASKIDGAKRIQQIIHITLPGIMPTILLLLLINFGSLLTVGYEKIILMYNPVTYDTADVISTYVYRTGIQSGRYSYAAAVDFLNQIVNFTLLIIFNNISKKLGGEGLW